MKKILLFVSMIVLLAACNSSTDSGVYRTNLEGTSKEVGEIFNPLIKEYPNYCENKIVRDSMQIRIIEHFKSCIGKPFTMLEYIPLEFFQIGSTDGNKADVWFSTDVYCHLNEKSLLRFYVRTEMSIDEASKLSSGHYIVSGVLNDWDYSELEAGPIMNLGTFFISDAKVKIYE